MDEFENLKHSQNKYAFVMYNPNSHKINDILENRLQVNINKYLSTISWEEKDSVKYVIFDMSESFRTVIHRHFRHATHIVDTFHYSRYVTDALNNIRIRIQSKYSEKSTEYRILKRYWSPLLKNQLELDDIISYNPVQQRSTSIFEIINDILKLDDELRLGYDLVQSFLYSLHNVKYEEVKEWLDSFISKLKESPSPEFKSLVKMFRNWYQEIINSFIRFVDRRLHNGCLEGINNKIKVSALVCSTLSDHSSLLNDESKLYLVFIWRLFEIFIK